MIRLIISFIGGLILFTSCEEYYHPDLDRMKNVVVIQAQICNDPNQSYVKVSKTANFNNYYTENPLSGANCFLISSEGETIEGYEQSAGNFAFPVIPTAGSKYKLQVNVESETYESDFETMPAETTFDSIYAVKASKLTYITNSSGKPSSVYDNGFELKIDAPISADNRYYLFNWRAVLQWKYTPLEIGAETTYGWKSYYSKNETFNIAGPKEYSNTDRIKNHTLLYRSTNSLTYLDSLAMVPSGWIIMIDQLSISEKSYTFYDKINDQLTASGQLFDPVYSQIYGNIHCTTNPGKVVLGNFNLCSYKHYRYFVNAQKNSKVIYQHEINRVTFILDNGVTTGTAPYFWVY